MTNDTASKVRAVLRQSNDIRAYRYEAAYQRLCDSLVTCGVIKKRLSWIRQPVRANSHEQTITTTFAFCLTDNFQFFFGTIPG